VCDLLTRPASAPRELGEVDATFASPMDGAARLARHGAAGRRAKRDYDASNSLGFVPLVRTVTPLQ
jgi:hypothetical protein